MEEFEKKLFQRLCQEIRDNRLILPSLPEIATQVREMTARSDCTSDELAQVISRDPAMSARLLKVANSSALRGGAPINTVRNAVARLGLKLVRSLITQLSILQLLSTERDKQQTRAFVESGLRIGGICHALAEPHAHLDSEQAMLAGLVHDIGKIPLRQYMAKVQKLQDNAPLGQEVYLRMHPPIGAFLLESWKFPPELVQVAAEHEQLTRDPGPEPDYTDLVIAANIEYYGTESGRYSELELSRVPAVVKTWPDDRAQMRETIAERMAFAQQAFAA